jgi:hypothetical protein
MAVKTNGVPQLFLKAWPGMSFSLQASTDLAHWETIASVTGTNPNGITPIQSTNAPASTTRFFRAIAP